MKREQHGAALMEFALAWPILLALVLGAVQLTVWASETMTARAAALAGARVGTVAGGTAAQAGEVAQRILAAGVVGVRATRWCPGLPPPAPLVWVCAQESNVDVTVEVGGVVPALVPVGFADGLPLHAMVTLQKEVFAP